MKTQRLLLTLFHLMRHGTASSRDLAEHLEVSKRTLYRDIEELRTAGVDIISTPGSGGGYRLSPAFKLDPAVFDKDGFEAMLLASKGLSTDRILIDHKYSFHGNDYFDKLAALERAVACQLMLHISYESPLCESMSTRGYAAPYGLVNKVGYWYLIAYCHEFGTYRAFNVSSISGFLVSDRRFDRDGNFDLKVFWESLNGRNR